MIVDYDLAELSPVALTHARTSARALAAFGAQEDVAGLARIAGSLLQCLDAEHAARQAGRGRGTIRLSIDALEDGDRDEAMRARLHVRTYLQLVRDDRAELQPVRDLFASVLADLSDPSPIARVVELAELERLAR